MSETPAHRIRLRKPWQFEPCTGGTRWGRHFNCPTGLGPQTKVFVVLEGFRVSGAAALNGQFLGSLPGDGSTARFDVSGRLMDRNELTLTIASGSAREESPAGGPPGEVCLEISEASTTML